MGKKLLVLTVFALVSLIAIPVSADTIAERLSGRILLQVEEVGQAWYVDPVTNKRAFLGRPNDAFAIMREFGLGVTNKDFDSWIKAPSRLAGRIILKVHDKGKAYYIDPINMDMHYLGRPADAFNVMRQLGLGINNTNLGQIPVHLGYQEHGNTSIIRHSSSCGPITSTIGQTITVGDVIALKYALEDMNEAEKDFTIILKDGDYLLDEPIVIRSDNVMIRGESGYKENVVLRGHGIANGVSHIFQVYGSDITIANLSMGEVANHAIQVHGESVNNAENLTVHNVRMYDTGEQMLKGSADSSGSDNGSVSCSLFEYTSNLGPQYYIGGIDVHTGKNWIVRDNTFKNIRSPEQQVAEHAIHFWNNSEGTIVERNKIINCDRGIGFGLGSSRHDGGVIRNNMIFNDGTGVKDDVGIGLESAPGAKVYNNTIYFDGAYPNAIEYRFAATTNVEIYDNLTNALILSRDKGTATLSHNYIEAKKSWFSDPNNGMLALNGRQPDELGAGYGVAEN